ncbi:hypothetical protein ONS96_004823 [Cadophora gregata f. sp. sojae]|nr:hypothetical protein ONS96_004823 [Cadophora gregata f. sp. sojae]
MGNGAVADNIWINSAYAAWGMADRKPWTYKNDMCVRTLVRTAGDILGRDFSREEPFQGTRHDALDDCRHQIRYMVKARNAMKSLSEKPKLSSNVLTTLTIGEEQDIEETDANHDDATTLSDPGIREPSLPPNDVTTITEAVKVLSTVPQQLESTAVTNISLEKIPYPQEPATDFQVSSSTEEVLGPSQDFFRADEDEDDADMDALLQAAFEVYEEERTPRSSQVDTMILPDSSHQSLPTIQERVADENGCGQQSTEASALKLSEQLKKMTVS